MTLVDWCRENPHLAAKEIEKLEQALEQARAILKANGLDGAVGLASLPVEQTPGRGLL